VEDRVEAELRSIADALAELAEAELRAMVVAANELVLEAAGLLLWMEHLADWELNRRVGLSLPLQSPEAAIPPEERAESVVAVTMLRDGFAEGSWADSAPVVALFDAIVAALTGTTGRSANVDLST
jgi:hypothetical protein